jgi:hypothetical protein
MRSMPTPPKDGPRMRLLALLMGIPTIIIALGISALEAYRWLQPDASLFAPPAMSLADAIANDDVRRTYELIRAGQDPAAPITVRHPDLTADRAVEVPPLVWAVAMESDWAVSMLLLRFGVHLDAQTQRRAVCLAERLRRPDIVRLLLPDVHDPVESCPDRKDSEEALLVN